MSDVSATLERATMPAMLIPVHLVAREPIAVGAGP
jgi:hypothetical protein